MIGKMVVLYDFSGRREERGSSLRSETLFWAVAGKNEGNRVGEGERDSENGYLGLSLCTISSSSK